VYVGIGWRFGYEVDGSLSVAGLQIKQGVFFDRLDGGLGSKDRSCSFGDNESIRGFANFLQHCVDSVKHMKEFRERFGDMEMHYVPKSKSIEINVLRNNKDDNSEAFISVVIPASEAANFCAAVKQVADNFEHINARMKPAKKSGASGSDKPSK
jgi:hypothetical protein